MSNSPADFLTVEESMAVDQAMMTASDRFSTRAAIYSLRVLKQIAQHENVTVEEVSDRQVSDWVNQEAIAAQAAAQGLDTGGQFAQFFVQLVLSSRRPLSQAAAASGVAVEDLTLEQVIGWFEEQAKQRVQGR
ncbi:MAG: hypothetical protein ACFB5Z_17875 [Elainellaceae cyanobacterium]